MFGKKDENQPDLVMFSYFDSKVQAYGEPLFAKNEEVLIRDLTNLFRNPRHSENRLLVNAEDFSVYRVATYDFKTGEFTAHKPQHVINLHELRAQAEALQKINPGIAPT